MDKYEKIQCLGKGNFGEAWLLKEKKTGKEVVMKQAQVDDADDTAMQALINELNVLTGVRHSNVVEFYRHIRLPSDVMAILMEYCPLGNLRDKIDTHATDSRYFIEDVIIRWLRHLANGLDHVHNQNIIHGDLKPDNIFLADGGSLKIGDFGISQFVSTRSASAHGGFVSSSLYTAPEIFQDESHTYRCDLWSLGVILYELITLRRPFKKPAEVMTGTYDRLPSTVHADLRTIVVQLLQMNPKDRTRCEDLLLRDILQYASETSLSKRTTVTVCNPFASAFGGKFAVAGASGAAAAASELDLAFVMDCTGSMQQYIDATKKGIKDIVEEINKAEKCKIRLALVEYRDHPPQDSTFVTRVHPFTEEESEMRGVLDSCVADGGGDTPEAVADALHELTCLKWKKGASRVAVMVVDAPPHGLKGFEFEDAFPDGCPDGTVRPSGRAPSRSHIVGHDPVSLCDDLSEDTVLYFVGCEPNSEPYRDVYDALANKTGGRYVPLSDSRKLAKLIIASSRAAMSYSSLTRKVAALTVEAAKKPGGDDEKAVARSVYKKVVESGSMLSVVSTDSGQLPPPSENARLFKKAKDLSELNAMIEKRKSAPAEARHGGDGAADYRVEATEPSVDLVSELSKKSFRKFKSDHT